MVARLDHTIIVSRDKHASAGFLARILGLDPPRTFGHFVTVETGNGVSLDYDDALDVRRSQYRQPMHKGRSCGGQIDAGREKQRSRPQ